MLLMALFFVLTLLHIPVYHIYAKSDFYQRGPANPTLIEEKAAQAADPNTVIGFSNVQTLSLGNMGFSKTECRINTMMPGNTATIKCNAGKISSLVDFGITTHFED